jgi:hypothetical protein
MKKTKIRRSKTFFKGGVPSLLGFGIMLLIGGIIAITAPIPYYSTGGTGKYASTNVTTSYSTSDTQGWGVIFLAMGLFLLFCAYRLQRNNKR